MNRGKRILTGLLALILSVGLGAAAAKTQTIEIDATDYPVTENGAYTSMQEVAVYLTQFGHLPDNFITKKQAQALGWDSRAGNLDEVAPGKSIGGDYFGNYEGNVPDAAGRKWTECDIDADGGYRNGKRIVFSNDGLIYYSEDHYESFRPVVVTESAQPAVTAAGAVAADVTEDGLYLTRDDVAAYLRAFDKLPANYLTKTQAKALGWTSKKDNLGEVAPGCAIGGERFANREGLLPDQQGRMWYECDVNVTDGRRSDERLVYSNDGLIYYTADNHKHFEQLE